MYVYTPPQGHHTPPIPWGGGGNTGHGTIYIYIYTWDPKDPKKDRKVFLEDVKK